MPPRGQKRQRPPPAASTSRTLRSRRSSADALPTSPPAFSAAAGAEAEEESAVLDLTASAPNSPALGVAARRPPKSSPLQAPQPPAPQPGSPVEDDGGDEPPPELPVGVKAKATAEPPPSPPSLSSSSSFEAASSPARREQSHEVLREEKQQENGQGALSAYHQMQRADDEYTAMRKRRRRMPGDAVADVEGHKKHSRGEEQQEATSMEEVVEEKRGSSHHSEEEHDEEKQTDRQVIAIDDDEVGDEQKERGQHEQQQQQPPSSPAKGVKRARKRPASSSGTGGSSRRRAAGESSRRGGAAGRGSRKGAAASASISEAASPLPQPPLSPAQPAIDSMFAPERSSSEVELLEDDVELRRRPPAVQAEDKSAAAAVVIELDPLPPTTQAAFPEVASIPESPLIPVSPPADGANDSLPLLPLHAADEAAAMILVENTSEVVEVAPSTASRKRKGSQSSKRNRGGKAAKGRGRQPAAAEATVAAAADGRAERAHSKVEELSAASQPPPNTGAVDAGRRSHRDKETTGMEKELAQLLTSQQLSVHPHLEVDAALPHKRLRSTAVNPPATNSRAHLDNRTLSPPPPSPAPRTRRSVPTPVPPPVTKKEEEVIEPDEAPADAKTKAPPSPLPPRSKRAAVLKTEVLKSAASSDKKSRKPKLPAVAGPVVDEEERKRVQDYLLEHPHDALSLKQSVAVYRLHFPPCTPLTSSSSTAPLVKCKGDHPNCLHSLGYRRKGIWASNPPHLALLGSNPEDSMRAQDYVGLKNQGATTLFMNRHFRDSLWQFESSDADVRRRWETAIREGAESIEGSSGSVLRDNLPYHLLSIFTELSLSRRSFVDPLSLINKLGLSHTDQQDAHEFRTYLMQALEDSLAASTFPTHRTLLQALFEGESTSVLRCMECQQQSRTSLPFVDLGVPIKGRASVYAGLQSLVEEELLEENAVYCSSCAMKRSMVKHVEYPQLPPYLNLQLMRFELVWHGNAVRKKKIADKVYIPEKINMRTCLAHHTPHNPTSTPNTSQHKQPHVSQTDTRATWVEQKQQSDGMLPPPPATAILPRLASPSEPSPSPLPPIPMSPVFTVSDEEMDAFQRQQAQGQAMALEEKAEREERSEDQTLAQLAKGKRRRKTASIGMPKRKGKAAAPQQAKEEHAEDANGADVFDFNPNAQPRPSPAKRSQKKSHKKKSSSKAEKEAIDLTSASSSSSSSVPAAPPAASVYSAVDDEDDYHLMAVLLHKGQFANHGHYTATLRDDQGCWWSFDDRTVRRLGDNFYNKGGEVVLDAAEDTKEQEKKEGGHAQQQPREKAEVVLVGGKQEEERKGEEVEDVVQGSPLPAAVVAEEAAVEAAASARPKRARASPKSELSADAPVLAVEVAADEDADMKEKGKGKKEYGGKGKGKGQGKAKADSSKTAASKAKRPRSDESGVDAKTKAEAKRVYGPGGYSKDAYMLLYTANRNHPKLRDLEQQHADAVRSKEEVDVLSRVEPHQPTFAVLQSHLPFASAFISRHRRVQIERDNREFEQSKVVYADKRRQVLDAVEARKAEVEAVVPLLQAEAMDMEKVRESMRLSVEEAAQAFEGDQPSRFIDADWLATFLTGWPVEVKAADKHKAKEREEKEAKDSAASTSKEAAAEKAERGSSADAIDVSSDSDDDGSRVSSPSVAKAEEVVLDDSKSADDGEKEGEDAQAQDRSHIVIDHDIHVSLAGMDEAVRTALHHLHIGTLKDALERIRCPHHSNKVSPHHLSHVKRITLQGWEQLTRLMAPSPGLTAALDKQPSAGTTAPTSVANVNPSSQPEEHQQRPPLLELALKDLCVQCARQLFMGDVERARDVEVERQLLLDLDQYRAAHKSKDRSGKSADTSHIPTGALWVDRDWVGRWKKHVRAMMTASKSAKDAAQQTALTEKLKRLRTEEPPLGNLTAGLLCPHGELDIDHTRRVFVSRELWERLLKAGDPDSKLLSVEAAECEVCRQQGQDESEEHKKHMQSMKDEKTALRTWSQRDCPFPDPRHPPEQNSSRHPRYFLVPCAFHSRVGAFIRSHDPADTRPQLDLSPLLCPHRLLRYQPRPEWEVGEHGLKGTPAGLFTYCDESVWLTLQRYGYVDEAEEGLRMTCKKVPGLPPTAAGTWEAALVETELGVCVQCCLERQKAEEAEQLRFTREDGGGITVVTVQSEEEAKRLSPLTASSMPSAAFHSTSSSSTPAESPGMTSPALPAVGASSRPRRHAGRRGAAAPAVHQLLCSSSDSLLSIKMELMQSLQLDCPPNRQQLWYQGQKMDSDRRLEDYGVLRGAEVRLLLSVDEQGEDFDLAAADADTQRKGKAPAERGFQGTALGWHARQLVSSAQPAAAATTTTPSVTVSAAPSGSAEENGARSLDLPASGGCGPHSPVSLLSPVKTEKLHSEQQRNGHAERMVETAAQSEEQDSGGGERMQE